MNAAVRFCPALNQILIKVKVASTREVQRFEKLSRFADEAHKVQWEKAIKKGEIMHECRRRRVWILHRLQYWLPCLFGLSFVIVALFLAVIVLVVGIIGPRLLGATQPVPA